MSGEKTKQSLSDLLAKRADTADGGARKKAKSATRKTCLSDASKKTRAKRSQHSPLHQSMSAKRKQSTERESVAGARRKSLRTRRPVETVVSTGDSSLKHMVKQKREEFAAYHKTVADAENKLAKVLSQLSKMKRTRRNLRLYNELVDQREILSKELTLLRINKPDEEEFYQNLQQFLSANRPPPPPPTTTTTTTLSVQQTSAHSTSEREQRTTLDNASNEKVVAAAAADKIESAAVELRPKHHSLVVTSGAPIFSANQFEMLCLLRADIQQKLETSVHGNVEQSRLDRCRAQFSAIMAREIRNQLQVEQMAAPMMFVLSPLGTGVPAACTLESVKMIRQGLREWNESGNDKDGNAKKPIVVTIGKSSAEDEDESSRHKKSNRLNVKMKDIRNMKNESMLNYVTVKEREKTSDEVQHANFKQFLAQRATEEAAKRRPRYGADVCEDCDEELEVNVHNGMVSCPVCGVTYSDGIDSHKWQAIAHVPHSKFEYLKSGHLVTLLKRFQGKEATVIPRDIIDKVAVYLSQKNYDLNRLTFKRMKDVLKKLNLNKFYDHAWQLLHIIADVRPIQFSEEQELAFQAVFDVLEEIYPLYKPKNYENFMFYWYIIGKTAQLLGHPQEIIDMFPLLKNPRKHQQKERIWRNMMNHVKWPYIVTYHDVEARRLLN